MPGFPENPNLVVVEGDLEDEEGLDEEDLDEEEEEETDEDE